MARKIGPKAKICRRYGVNLFVSGDRSTSLSRTLTKRNYPPGVHGPKGRGKLTGYGEQLAEKQKAKLVYGLLERQFRKYYDEAIRQKGDSGENLLRMLEMRLDNVVYRLGFANTRAQARQMVSHGMFTVKGVKVDIPSYQVKTGEEVAVAENKRKSKLFADLSERVNKQAVPVWLVSTPESFSGKILDKAKKDDAEKIFDIRSVIEFYSR